MGPKGRVSLGCLQMVNLKTKVKQSCRPFGKAHSELQKALLLRGIPFRLSGDTSVMERRITKDIFAYLRLLVSPDDHAAFRRVFNVPRRGLGGHLHGTEQSQLLG